MSVNAFLTDRVAVSLDISELDGATLVQIDTDENVGRLRVYVNEAALFDQDPELPGPLDAAMEVCRAIADLRATDPEEDYEPEDISSLIAAAEKLADMFAAVTA